ncbi:MAG: hypothetical protein COV98_04065 [Candidatus Altarchaeum sp. CG12_big_fil_rev_8_21_14_0_65_33_22]|nr:MAG: hypothetical protein AUK59_05305 [Candidatus Altarchaeum sp. CG2_30_32_3053]PIN67220.1 MAG: hypothetical protein COV98_04065 [Candidatus Altarchaeum sp. CG12_big_fil_rev_8_21_14_0_65_33_22]PIX49289.1 MAG: hypothetical protein COZ53_01115 [Candidatus Altarchaeum sp. CG_4_8_14_3_um_filter_33_2054]PIZ29349.1 MAG: hypothetical protein COY41_05790 [Candidatus Altarchaeum sp. CG_4_10_14_0_8_um_filter_32_851]
MEKENSKSEREGIPEKIKENLDLLIASGGVLLGIFIIYMSLAFNIHQQDIGGAILIASALYIWLRKRLLKASETFLFKPTKKFIYINNIIFFVAVSLSVLLLHFTLYSRPPLYFILVAVACCSVALEILYSNKKWSGLILIKILLIGINLYGGIYYEFPGDIVGVDTRLHNYITEQTIEQGHVIPNQPYFYFPIFHTLAAQMNILTPLNVYDSIFSSTTFLLAFSVIFIFLLGKKLINTRTGLLAALMFVFADWVIGYSLPIPMSLGFVFFTIILYLLIINIPKPFIRRIVAFFLFVILVLTHTVAGFVMVVVAICFYVFKNANKYLNNISSIKFAIFVSTIIAFSIMLLGYWMYAFECPTCNSFLDYGINALYMGITKYSIASETEELATVQEKVSTYVASNYFEYMLDHLGYLIFLGIGIIGTYIWIKSKDEFKVPLCITMVVLFAFIYGFNLVGITAIMPTRWFIFAYVILAIVSAYGLFKLINLINRRFALMLFLITIFLMSFFMIASTISNNDSPLYHKEHVNLCAYKQSQLEGISSIHEFFNGTYGPISFYGKIDPAILSVDYNFSKDKDKMYVIRKDAFIYPRLWTTEIKRAGAGATPYILNEKFKKRVELNSNEIYDNGEVWGYVIKD